MWKKLIIILLALIALVVLLVVIFGGRYAGDAVEAGISNYGPQITGTSIEMGEVEVDTWDGRATVADLVIGNPQGYEGDFAMRIPQAQMEVDLGSILSDTIVVRRLAVHDSEVRLETQDDEMNLRRIRNNVAATLGDEDPGPRADRKKYIIDELVIDGGQVSVRDSDIAEVSMPTMRLRDLGRNSDGLLAEELVQQILDAMIEEMVPLVGEQAAGLVDDPEEAVGFAERATSAVQGIFGGGDDEEGEGESEEDTDPDARPERSGNGEGNENGGG